MSLVTWVSSAAAGQRDAERNDIINLEPRKKFHRPQPVSVMLNLEQVTEALQRSFIGRSRSA